MQAKVFEEGMKRLVEVFGEITVGKTALYWEALQDLPDGGFVLAVKESIKRSEYFPRPKHLRDFAAPYRLPQIEHPYNANQIEEFTVQAREEAKESLQRLMDGLESWEQQQVAV